MNGLNPGSIVRCRNRDWILLPSPNPSLYRLRPLTGSEKEIVSIHHALANLGIDQVTTTTFPLPTADDAKDGLSAQLLWQASRLTLREGAGPFRSLGRISVRPRPYQFVPLMMALRLDPVRMLIADDVGVGKTIEALLIARELLDRGEIQQLCILCPPYLCDQWQKELWEKFQLEAVVIRSGTISQLQRRIPAGDEYSVFNYYPITVVSIDFAKTERNRPLFLTHCPDFVIVDEAHSAARPSGATSAQQQRHELLRKIAEKQERHLVLLTATPHSGIEESFRSLLGLLRPEFSQYDFNRLRDKQRDELVKHFVQRRRADVLKWLGEDTPFPERVPDEISYELSKGYRDLFEQVYGFSKELVRRGEHLTGWKQRIRYWAALALLRCVMSSPAAALAAIQARHQNEAGGEVAQDEESLAVYSPFIYEPTDEASSDAQPAHILGDSWSEMGDSERRRLREFAQLASKLGGEKHDRKLAACLHLVRSLLSEGHHPILWCRYIATAKYVAEHLQQALHREFAGLRVVSVTGEQADEERRTLVEELEKAPCRVLVATDCLSEGVNLQQGFSAVVHYDLPWNPNRLEQREGRVDRFGQPSAEVKAVLMYGKDNPIDGAVLNVLLRKAKQINKALGITVPIPEDSETVMQTVLNALFSPGTRGPSAQPSLFEDMYISEVHQRWEAAAAREKESRTRFAQRAIKPEEVQRELEATDSVLGDPKAVEGFVQNSCQRLQVTLNRSTNCHWIMSGLEQLPDMVKDTVPGANGKMPLEWRVGFTAPVLPGVTYVGRNHPFVATLAQFLMEQSLSQGAKALATRCGVIRTRLIERRTVLLLLRLRYKVAQDELSVMLAEESFVIGYHGFAEDGVEWITPDVSRNLLEQAAEQIADNVSEEERRELINDVLTDWTQPLQPLLQEQIELRATELAAAHHRVRASLKLRLRGLKVSAILPADLLGLVVLMPVPKGVVQ